MAKRGRRATHLSSVILIVALVSFVAACADTSDGVRTQVAGPTPSPASTRPPLPTATLTLTIVKTSGPPIAGRAAVWMRANLPAGFGMLFHVSDLQVAASDGATAYSCQGARVVVTHDAGVSWE